MHGPNRIRLVTFTRKLSESEELTEEQQSELYNILEGNILNYLDEQKDKE